jgi:hypothetical protein
LAAILAFVLITILANVGTDELASGYDVALLILGLTANIGFLVVLIVGVGVFDQDLSPKLHTFWRSRPIDPDQWYWTKYVAGLVVLAVALLLPVGISSMLSWAWHPRGELPFQLEHLAMVACVYWAVYALAASTICLIRVTIYAAILSGGTVAMGMVVLWLFWDSTEMEVSKMLTTVGRSRARRQQPGIEARRGLNFHRSPAARSRSCPGCRRSIRRRGG